MKKIIVCILFVIITAPAYAMHFKLQPKMLSKPVRHFSTKRFDYINAAQVLCRHKRIFCEIAEIQEWLNLINRIRFLEEIKVNPEAKNQHRMQSIIATKALLDFRLRRDLSDHIILFTSVSFATVLSPLITLGLQSHDFSLLVTLGPVTALSAYVGYRAYKNLKLNKKFITDLKHHLHEKYEQVDDNHDRSYAKTIISSALEHTKNLSKNPDYEKYTKELQEEFMIDLESLTHQQD
jgi:hypothetical protein